MQGYVELKSAKTRSALLKQPGFHNVHVQARHPRSNKLKAVTYCAKEFAKPYYESAMEQECMETYIDENGKSGTRLNKEAFERRLTEKLLLKWMRENPEQRRNNINSIYNKLFFEAGEWNHGLNPGKRSDINVVREIANTGGNMRQIAEASNTYQSLMFGQKLLNIKPPTRNWDPIVIWVHGNSGSGKTKACIDRAKELKKEYWISNSTFQWFDGYDGQEVVIFDDFREDQCKLQYLLRLTDKTPMRVPIKGGFVDWVPRFIFFTSVLPLDDAFTCESHDQENMQFKRRIIGTIEIDTPKVPHKSEISEEQKMYIEKLTNSFSKNGRVTISPFSNLMAAYYAEKNSKEPEKTAKPEEVAGNTANALGATSSPELHTAHCTEVASNNRDCADIITQGIEILKDIKIDESSILQANNLALGARTKYLPKVSNNDIKIPK